MTENWAPVVSYCKAFWVSGAPKNAPHSWREEAVEVEKEHTLKCRSVKRGSKVVVLAMDFAAPVRCSRSKVENRLYLKHGPRANQSSPSWQPSAVGSPVTRAHLLGTQTMMAGFGLVGLSAMTLSHTLSQLSTKFRDVSFGSIQYTVLLVRYWSDCCVPERHSSGSDTGNKTTKDKRGTCPKLEVPH